MEKNKKKKIEILLLIILFTWALIFLINYINYSNSKPLILAISKTHEYKEGTVKEYISLGYIYRVYNLTNLQREELVPFWVSRKRIENKNGLPITEKDYNVPENEKHSDKYKGLLYYYDTNKTLIGTYKCLNSVRNCDKAIGGKDEYDIYNADPIYKREETYIDTIYDKYAFIEDGRGQELKNGETTADRTIYLFDIKKNELLAEYSDIKSSFKDEYTKKYSGDRNNYILKNTEGKWGLIHIDEEGKQQETLPYEYDSINYDDDTGYYILSKNKKWFIYSLDVNDIISYQFDEVIYDIWINSNQSRYIKLGTKNENGEIRFKIKRIDNTDFISDQEIGSVFVDKDFILYEDITESKIKIVNYGKDILQEYPLFFTELTKDELHHPAYELEEDNKTIKIKIYDGRELINKYNIYTFKK